MIVFIVIVSILVLTGLVYWFNHQFKFAVCPICAGVSLTWLWILVGIYFGWLEASNWVLAAATLLGGSVVGIAYQAEKHYLRHDRSALLWKLFFIPAGFAVVYGLVTVGWLLAGLALIAALAVAAVFLHLPRHRHQPGESREVIELEKKMKGCC